jgi:hypothetical protein
MGAPVARAALGVQRLGGTDDRIQSTANREKLSDEKNLRNQTIKKHTG